MMNTTAGQEDEGASVQTSPTRETVSLTGRAVVLTGGRSLTDTGQKVVRGAVH